MTKAREAHFAMIEAAISTGIKISTSPYVRDNEVFLLVSKNTYEELLRRYPIKPENEGVKV